MDDVEVSKLYQSLWMQSGANCQLDILIEEMAELTQAILKARRKGMVFSRNFLEEYADVMVCMEQVKEQLVKTPLTGYNGCAFDTVLDIRDQKLGVIAEVVKNGRR